MQTPNCVLGYRIDLYLHDYDLAIEIYEYGHSDINDSYHKETKEEIEEGLSCEFIRIYPDEENFNEKKL